MSVSSVTIAKGFYQREFEITIIGCLVDQVLALSPRTSRPVRARGGGASTHLSWSTSLRDPRGELLLRRIAESPAARSDDTITKTEPFASDHARG